MKIEGVKNGAIKVTLPYINACKNWRQQEGGHDDAINIYNRFFY